MSRKRAGVIMALKVFFAVALSVTSLVGSPGAANAREDLGLLKEMSSTQSYEALVRTVQSRPVSSGEFTFVVLGDSRGNMEMAQKIYRQAALEKPVFIISTGDVVPHGTVDEYLNYHQPLLKAIEPVPLIPVPGNHERGPDKDFAGFLAIYGSDRVSLDVGGCRFVGVNNSDADSLSEDDLQFIDLELSKPGEGKTKFVFMHYPPVYVERDPTNPSEEMNYRGFTRNENELRQLLKQRRVAGAFFGHDHGFAAREIDGVHHFITAGAGADLYEKLKWLEPVHHYLVVRVTPKAIAYEVVRLDGGGNGWTRTKVADSERPSTKD
jgi:predicted phosphodiesterase